MVWVDIAVALAIAVGLVGILVPILPGSILVGAAVVVWAIAQGGTTAYVVGLVAVVLLAAGTALKWLLPHRRLSEAGVPASTQWVGAALAVVGFFVIPVVGLVVGFVVGVLLAEWRRLGSARAWSSTRTTLVAVGVGILIELCFALGATAAWGVGLLVS